MNSALAILQRGCIYSYPMLCTNIIFPVSKEESFTDQVNLYPVVHVKDVI